MLNANNVKILLFKISSASNYVTSVLLKLLTFYQKLQSGLAWLIINDCSYFEPNLTNILYAFTTRLCSSVSVLSYVFHLGL